MVNRTAMFLRMQSGLGFTKQQKRTMGGVPIILRGAEGALFIHKNTDKSYCPLPHVLRGAEGVSIIRKTLTHSTFYEVLLLFANQLTRGACANL